MNTTFGDKIARVKYTLRKGVYAVIINDQAVAAIQGTSSYFLPGGGIEEEETDEETLTRELQEECDASVEIHYAQLAKRPIFCFPLRKIVTSRSRAHFI